MLFLAPYVCNRGGSAELFENLFCESQRNSSALTVLAAAFLFHLQILAKALRIHLKIYSQ